MNPRSFRSRLIFLVIMVLVPAAALVLVANVQRQQAEKARIREQAVSAAKLAASSQSHFVKQSRQLLATMTQIPSLVLSTNRTTSQKGMSNLKLLSRDFSDLGLIERDGSVFCHTLGSNATGEVISE